MRRIREADRPDLCQMLEASDDFPQATLGLYRHPRRWNPEVTFVAPRGGSIVGMLTGSFDSDLAESGAFEAFELPPAPHAFLARVHVDRSARSRGVGRALVRAYASDASDRGCTFIGGSIDLASEPNARKAFFNLLGFTICDRDNFGARPAEVLAAIARL